MSVDTKTFQRLLPALQHLAKFSGANRSVICQKYGVAVEDVVRVITVLCGALSLWDEEALEVAAKKFNVVLPPWKPTAFTPRPAPVAPASAPARKPAAPPAAVKVPPKAVRSLEPRPPLATAPVKLSPEADLGRWLDVQRIKISEKISNYVIEVTPEIAATWLNFNMANRKPSKAKIRRFAVAMKTHRWTVNGECLKFSRTGRLIDGQSRLMAIIEAGVPAFLEVRAGLPDLAQDSMDCGELRKGSHTLEMMGEANPGVLAPALRQMWLFERGWLAGYPFGSSRVMENQEVKPLLEKHAALKVSAGWVVSDGYKIANLLPRSEAAFFHYLFGIADPKLRDAFFESLVDGTGLTKLSPVYHLREKMLELRRTTKTGGRSGDYQKTERAALFIKSWNAAVAGESMTSLRWKKNGEHAEKFPKFEVVAADSARKGAA